MHCFILKERDTMHYHAGNGNEMFRQPQKLYCTMQIVTMLLGVCRNENQISIGMIPVSASEQLHHQRIPSTQLVRKTSTHLAFSALKWFEKVRGGSLRLNHPEIAYRYPTHLVPPVKMRFGKVRYSRTTPKPCERPLHTLLSLY